MDQKEFEQISSNFRVVPKRKLGEAEKQSLLLSIERMKLEREKTLLILGASIILFFAFLVVAVVGVLNGLINRKMLNVLVIVGFASLVVGIIPYARFVMTEQKSLENTLKELIS